MGLSPYLNILIASFKEEMTYRLDFLAGIIAPFIQIIVLWFVWSAVFSSSPTPEIRGFTFSTMITYTAVAIVMRSYVYPNIEFFVEEGVRTGSIATILIKPLSYPLFCFARHAGQIAIWMITYIPIVLFSFLILGINGPASLLFFVSAFIGYLISYLLVFITAMWAFWTTGQIWGLRLSRIIISEIASGALIPLSLFPLWLQNILNFLPFQAVFYMPLTIYIGTVSGYAALVTLLIQLAWLGILFSVSYFIWKASIRRIVVQGG